MENSVVVDDSKLGKFKIIVDKVDIDLSGRVHGTAAFSFVDFVYKRGDPITTDHRLFYDLSIFKKYVKNPFVKVLVEYFAPPHIYFSPSNFDKHPEEITTVSELSDLSDLCKHFVWHTSGDWYIDRYYRLIFWLLFTAAIDKDFYNNELSTVTDFATKCKLNDAAIRDFCHAVEYILTGNAFKENCKLNFEDTARSHSIWKIILLRKKLWKKQ